MSSKPKVGLDKTVLGGFSHRRARRATRPPIILMNGGLQKKRAQRPQQTKTAKQTAHGTEPAIIKPQPYAKPAQPRLQRSRVLKRASY